MRIAVGNDHAGFELKGEIVKHLQGLGHEVADVGHHSAERADYPTYGQRVGEAVVAGSADLGILICGSGVGISIAANKVDGVRCVCCSDPYTARLSRLHNNANVLALGARVVGPGLALLVVDTWLEAQFEGGRHAERLQLIEVIENSRSGKAAPHL